MVGRRAVAVVAALTLAATIVLSSCSSSDGSSPGSDTTSTSAAGEQSTDGGPTTPEIDEAIKTAFTETYGVDNGGAQFQSITFDFGEPQVGSPAKRSVDYGAARTVWPVKVVVTMTITYSNNPTVKKTTRGDASDDVFFFYRNEFGGWSFRTGSL